MHADDDIQSTRPLPATDFSPESGSVTRELVIFYGVTLTITILMTVRLWKLPSDFSIGDVEAIRRAVGDVAQFAILAPVLSAIGVTLAFRGWRGLSALLRRIVLLRVSPLYYAIALLFPPIPQWIAAVIWSRLAGAEIVYLELSGLLSYWLQVTMFGAVVLLGEEIGWRGFMLPRLLTIFSWRSAAIIGGVLWTAWHIPFWAPANYAATGSVLETAIILVMATLGVVSLSVVITWLFIRTRYSVAIAALLHGSGNASMYHVYEMLGDGAGDLTWVICYNVVLVVAASGFQFLGE